MNHSNFFCQNKQTWMMREINARLITYLTRIEVRNCRRTLFTFEHTALLFW